MFKAVLLREQKGDIEEILINESDIYKYLKGPATFIGAYPECDVVVMACRESMFELCVNQNTLPPPMEGEVVTGPILLTKMEPEDFTLADWESMLSSLTQP